MEYCLILLLRMAAKSYEAGYREYAGNRFDNITHDTSEEQIRELYDDWAKEYDEVTRNFFVIFI